MGRKNQAKIDFLSEYKSAQRRVKALRMQLDALKIEKYSIKGLSYEGGDMPRGHNQTDVADLLIKLREREAKLKRQIANAIEIQTRVVDVINRQDDALEMIVLTCKYVKGMAWKEISAEIGLNSESRPREIHGEALEKLHWEPPIEAATENNDGI